MAKSRSIQSCSVIGCEFRFTSVPSLPSEMLGGTETRILVSVYNSGKECKNMLRCQYCDKPAYKWGDTSVLCFDHVVATLLANMLIRRGQLINVENAQVLIAQYPKLTSLKDELEGLLSDVANSGQLSPL